MSETTTQQGPEIPPDDTGDTRMELAWQFLRGDGLEIGALHLPTALPPGARARYVDRMSVVELRAHYPELAGVDLTSVDVIDDGEQLASIDSESVDFIVANHFLEHCQDPIATIMTHLSKLRPGGTLFYAVPDKRYTFDRKRPRTSLQHVIDDHERGPEQSRSQHYLEWVNAGLVPDFRPRTHQEIADRAATLEAEGYSIHFHVWTQADLAALIYYIHERLGTFEVEAIRRHNIENIVVLRKSNEWASGTDRPLSSTSPWTAIQTPFPSAMPPGTADLRRRVADLERELMSERDAHLATRQQAELLNRRLMRADEVLRDVIGSSSWRVTKPLRSAKRRLTKRSRPAG